MIELARNEIDRGYFSSFLITIIGKISLFVYFASKFLKPTKQLVGHMTKCDAKHQHGDKIYWQGSLSIFEVDGEKQKIYKLNLCYLAKLFLHHKILHYDVDDFEFLYLM